MPNPEISKYQLHDGTRFITYLMNKNRFAFEIKNKLVWSLSVSVSTGIEEFQARLGKGGTPGFRKLTKVSGLVPEKRDVHEAVHGHLGPDHNISDGMEHDHWVPATNAGLDPDLLLRIICWHPQKLKGGVTVEDAETISNLVQGG